MLGGNWSSFLNHRRQRSVGGVRTVGTTGGVMPTGACTGSVPRRSLQEEVRVASFHDASLREDHHLWQVVGGSFVRLVGMGEDSRDACLVRE